LNTVTVNFNVMTSATLPLASQAPVFAPEVDPLPNVLSYSFGYKTVLKHGIVNIGGMNDVLQSGQLPIWIRYVTSPGMTNNLYYRVVPGFTPATAWTSIPCTGAANYADGTATCEIPSPIALTLLGLSFGENLQFIVTAVKNGEESVKDFAAPLTIAPTLKPFAINPALNWNPSTSVNPRPEWGASQVTGRTTVDFDEPMYGSVPVLAPLSGGIAALQQNAGTGRWTSMSEYAQDLTITFNVPASTLGEAHTIGETRIKLAVLGTASSRFAVGDKVVIGPATSGVPNREVRTISAVDTRNSVITTDALTQSHAQAEAVFLLDSASANPGLTYFRTLTTAPSRAGDTTVAVTAGTGARFYVGQNLQFLRQDPTGASGYLPAVVGQVDTIAGDVITLADPLANGVPTGSIVLDAAVTQAEPRPRPALELASTDQVMFDASAAVTTALSNDQFATGPDVLPKEIDVGSTAGIYQGDVVTIAASAVSLFTAAGPTGTVTQGSTQIMLVPGTAQSFRAGDEVELEGIAPAKLMIAPNTTTTVNASGQTINLTAMSDIRAGDILRFWEDQVTTATIGVNQASAAGVAAGVQVGSTSGFAVGQVVTLDDRQTPPLQVAVTSVIDTNHLSFSGLGANQSIPSGAILYKPEMADDVLPNADTTGLSPTIPAAGSPGGFAAGDGYSPGASLLHLRPNRRATILSITVDALTTTPSGGGFPPSNAINLVSEAEQFVVGKVATGYALQLVSGTGLQFAHRAGAAVTKASQTSFIVGAGQLNNVLVGDTIVIQRDTTVDPLACKDRFSGTVMAVDSSTGEVTLATTQTGFYDFSLLTHAEILTLGDAVNVTGQMDSNGLPAETAYGFRMSLGSAFAR
jgi:hypothetical protein